MKNSNSGCNIFEEPTEQLGNKTKFHSPEKKFEPSKKTQLNAMKSDFLFMYYKILSNIE